MAARVFLKALPPLSESVVMTTSSPSLSESRAETILVVDDQAAPREFISTILKRVGFRVLIADGSEQAVQIARETRDLDLLITDVEMPGGNGDELAEWIRISRPDVPVLFMSGNPLNRHRLNGMPFVDKPFQPIQLLDTVRSLLVGRANRSSRLAPSRP